MFSSVDSPQLRDMLAVVGRPISPAQDSMIPNANQLGALPRLVNGKATARKPNHSEL